MGLFGQPKIKDGISAQAVVMSVPAPTEPARSYHLKITLSVRVPGREPYLLKHSCWVHATKYPSPGTVLPVTVEQQRPEPPSHRVGSGSDQRGTCPPAA